VDRDRADYLHYKAQALLNAMLSGADRWAMMQDLYEAHLAIQATKSPEELAREKRAEWILKRPRFNPRYLALLEEANRADRGAS
jgi:hypothetical protein